jgi:hypothetical protein
MVSANFSQKIPQEEKEADISWARQIKDQAKWRCEICGSPDRPNAHHIIPREFRQTRHDLNNGISLCVKHHKFSLEISPHKNAFAFFEWLQKYFPEKYNYLKETWKQINKAN